MRKSNLSCFTDCTKHASAGTLIHRQQTIYWIFTQTKLNSIYRHKLYYHLLGLDKISSVAYNSGEFQFKLAIIIIIIVIIVIIFINNIIIIIIIFYFSVEIDYAILASLWQEEGNVEVLKRCYIQIYPTSFLLCFGKAVNLQHM